jgi:predicted protein tyrosine phosphatase
MKIVTASIGHAEDLYPMFDFTISCVDHERQIDQLWPSSHCVELFGDEVNPELSNAPRPEHVERILNWTSNILPASTVLVHCIGGSSRSTAVGIAIYVQHGMEPYAAAAEIYNHRFSPYVFWPNQLVLTYAGQILNRPNLLKEVYRFVDEVQPLEDALYD